MAACFSIQAQAKTEITTTDVPTLIGKKSTQLSVLGFDLSMTRAQAEAVLKNSKTVFYIQDVDNPGRIYVYSKKADGKEVDLLYLIWDGSVKMKQITVFADMAAQLKPNFKRLLTFEKNAGKEKADFIMKFVGRPDSTKVTLEMPSIGVKNTTYSYTDIGFEIINKVNRDGESMVFALIQPKT